MVEKLMTNTVKDDVSLLPGIYSPRTEYQYSSIFVDTDTELVKKKKGHFVSFFRDMHGQSEMGLLHCCIGPFWNWKHICFVCEEQRRSFLLWEAFGERGMDWQPFYFPDWEHLSPDQGEFGSITLSFFFLVIKNRKAKGNCIEGYKNTCIYKRVKIRIDQGPFSFRWCWFKVLFIFGIHGVFMYKMGSNVMQLLCGPCLFRPSLPNHNENWHYRNDISLMDEL